MYPRANDIQLLNSHEVDFTKWDKCVERSSNCLIYGISDYLNYTADNWKGLVVADYAAVMPIPWRRKFGITYTYNVPFLQQAGIYGNTDSLAIEKAIKAIKSFCSYGTYYFNYGSRGTFLKELTNLVLPLNVSAGELYQSFTNDAKRNIQRSMKFSLDYTRGDIDETISLFKRYYAGSLKISERQYNSFRDLCKLLHNRDWVEVRQVKDAGGSTLSTMLMLKFNKRLYNVMNATSQKGRKLSANYLLFYSIFQEFENSGYLFDFEGSDHPGIRQFYLQFTNTNQPYYCYHFNNLPLPLRLIKR